MKKFSELPTQTIDRAIGYAVATYYANSSIQEDSDLNKVNAIWGALEVFKIQPLSSNFIDIKIGLEAEIAQLEESGV